MHLTALEIHEAVQDILSGSYGNLTVAVSNTTNVTCGAHRSADKDNFNLVQTYYESCLADENIPNHADLALMRLFTGLFPFIKTNRHVPTTDARGFSNSTDDYQANAGKHMTDSFIKMSKIGINAFFDIYPATSTVDHVSSR